MICTSSWILLGEAIKMSNEGFKGVPGVPEGWELVEFRCGEIGEHVIDGDGKPYRLLSRSVTFCAIIRKIEVPKRYRPFANGAEYIAKRRDGIAVDWKTGETNGFYAIVSANDIFAWVAFGKDVEVFNWKQAFERLVFRHVDGSTSPFGVEVTDE
jgi:hypothetical protein